MRKQLFCTIIIGFMTFSIFACNDSENTSQRSSNTPGKEQQIIEPCALISKQEAEKLIGEQLKDAEIREQEKVGLKLCLYDSVQDNLNKSLQISVTQSAFMDKKTLESGQSPKSIFESLKANFEEELTKENIGDDAFIATTGIHIFKSGYYIVINVGNISPEPNRDILRNAGKLAVENLEQFIK
ncbi:hypothetical protein U27_04471 [Candidatus Vecturithrix granuli]|uniref:Lipoprotein n=1 Tax=Vecturithrix granuli TaxID=1499967 RepID=A0A081BYU9_VECG1|nr:hypothetical protein U27_04471 [Candidatus Vecturithrix granuli]